MEELQIRDNSVYARYLLSKARFFMVKARQKELAPYEISSRQVFIMDIIFNLGHKVTLSELAKYSNRGIGAVSVQLTKMESEGLIRKVRGNPRSTLLKFELTEKGLDIYHSCQKLKGINTIMSALSEKELKQFITMLEKIIKKAEKVSKRPNRNINFPLLPPDFQAAEKIRPK